ncbi:MAG TPA: ATP-binding protein, partial [Thermoanaerobaculia bacterium]|nr:ATP-binding protein [Thermoanaerobaculia bacterium]
MTDGAAFSRWQRANQEWLAAALAEIRRALAAHLEDAAGEVPAMPEPSWEGSLPAPPALEMLCRTFDLSDGDRLLLLLCAGAELDAAIPGLCARAQGDPQRTSPTLSLALALFPQIPWTSLSPAAPLRYWRLIEVGPGTSLVLAPLRLEELVLHYLAGQGNHDERLAGL